MNESTTPPSKKIIAPKKSVRITAPKRSVRKRSSPAIADPHAEVIINIRKRNLLYLRAQFERDFRRRFPDEPARGMDKKFAAHLGVSRAYFGHVKTGFRNIGNTLARDFEKACGMPIGWLDRAHGEASSADIGEQEAVALMLRVYREDPNGARRVLMSALQDLGRNIPPSSTQAS